MPDRTPDAIFNALRNTFVARDDVQQGFALQFGNPGDRVWVRVPQWKRDVRVICGSVVNSTNVVVMGGYVFCDQSPRETLRVTDEFNVRRRRDGSSRQTTEEVGKILYLYSITEADKIKFYVGGFAVDSVLVKELDINADINAASVDNRGAATWNVNIRANASNLLLIDETGTTIDRTRDLGALLSTRWQCVGFGIWVLQEAIADVFLNTFYNVATDELRGGNTVGSEDNNNTQSPYWLLPDYQITNLSYAAFYRTTRINPEGTRGLGGLINRESIFATETVRNAWYSGTTTTTYTPTNLTPPNISSPGTYGLYYFDLRTTQDGFSIIPRTQPDSQPWFTGLEDDTDKQIEVDLYDPDFVSVGTDDVLVYKPSVVGDNFLIYNMSYKD